MLFTIIGFGLLILFFFFLNLFINGELNIAFNSLTISKNNDYTTIDFSTGLEYCAFFDIMIPTIYYSSKTNGSTYTFSFNLFSEALSLPPSDFIEGLKSSKENSTVQSSELKSSSGGDFDQLFYGIYIALLIFSIYFAIAGSMLAIIKGSLARAIGIVIIILTIAAFITSSILLLNYLSQIGGITELFRIGFIIGMFINFALGLGILSSSSFNPYLQYALTIYAVQAWTTKVFLESLKIYDSNLILEAPNLTLVFLGVLFGLLAFSFVDDDYRCGAGVLFCIASLTIACLLLKWELNI